MTDKIVPKSEPTYKSVLDSILRHPPVSRSAYPYEVCFYCDVPFHENENTHNENCPIGQAIELLGQSDEITVEALIKPVKDGGLGFEDEPVDNGELLFLGLWGNHKDVLMVHFLFPDYFIVSLTIRGKVIDTNIKTLSQLKTLIELLGGADSATVGMARND